MTKCYRHILPPAASAPAGKRFVKVFTDSKFNNKSHLFEKAVECFPKQKKKTNSQIPTCWKCFMPTGKVFFKAPVEVCKGSAHIALWQWLPGILNLNTSPQSVKHLPASEPFTPSDPDIYCMILSIVPPCSSICEIRRIIFESCGIYVPGHFARCLFITFFYPFGLDIVSGYWPQPRLKEFIFKK